MNYLFPGFLTVLGLATMGNALASNNAEGKQLYVEYGCSQCHGADAKTSNSSTTPKLAGMNVDDVYLKTKRYIETRAHDSVWRGCGETPNHVQLKRIAEYVATLPR